MTQQIPTILQGMMAIIRDGLLVITVFMGELCEIQRRLSTSSPRAFPYGIAHIDFMDKSCDIVLLFV